VKQSVFGLPPAYILILHHRIIPIISVPSFDMFSPSPQLPIRGIAFEDSVLQCPVKLYRHPQVNLAFENSRLQPSWSAAICSSQRDHCHCPAEQDSLRCCICSWDASVPKKIPWLVSVGRMEVSSTPPNPVEPFNRHDFPSQYARYRFQKP
jgi:hypothetical protein